MDEVKAVVSSTNAAPEASAMQKGGALCGDEKMIEHNVFAPDQVTLPHKSVDPLVIPGVVPQEPTVGAVPDDTT
jgi:hypothetical protein